MNPIMDDKPTIDHYDGLGGSVCAAILGLDKNKTPYALWEEFVDPAKRPQIDQEEQIVWGRLLERPIGEEAARRLGLEVHYQPRTIWHPEISFMRANADFLVTSEDAGLECKNRGLLMLRQYDLASDDVGDEDRVLPTEALQSHAYMAITGRKRWYLGVLVGGQRLLTFKFDRDEALCRRIEEAYTEFWGYVQRREPPPPMNVEDCHKLWPGHVPGKVVEATDDIYHAVEQRRILKEKITQAEGECEFLDFKIKAFMGDAEELRYGGKPVMTWKRNKSSLQFDEAGFKADNPDLHDRYLREKDGARVMRAKKR